MVNDPGSPDTLGVGLISVVWMGKLHSRAYQAIPVAYPELGLRPRLVHAADTAPERRDYARDVLGYARSSTDYRDVLADPDVEVVSICAPNHLHRTMAVAAAEAGKPFWIEKPVGRSAEETSDVAAAARAAGVETSIGYNYRGAPAVERIRELVARGELGRDLLSHVVDLVQYVVGPIAEVASLLSTVHTHRPILPMGSGTHFAVIEDGEMAPVENDDHAAALIRFAAGPHTGGAVGTLEASRVIVGPQCRLALEVYGTEGSATWDFERMNELHLCLERGGPNVGYTTVLANASMGDYARFQPGPANSMGYDDLKVIEAAKFLTALRGGERRNSTIYEAHLDAEVLAAAAASAEDGLWHKVPEIPEATFGRDRRVGATRG